MARLRDVVPHSHYIAGERLKLPDIVGRELTFTDWSVRGNDKLGGQEFLILQYYVDGSPFVVMTSSRCLIEDIRAYEKKAGKEPFDAVIVP